MTAIIFNILMGVIFFIVSTGTVASIIYAYKEFKKASVEEQVRRAQAPYNTSKAYTSHRW